MATAPLDLSSVVHAVHFSYRPAPGGFAGGHDSYAVGVDAAGAVSFAPAIPAPAGAGAARSGAPLRLDTVAVSRGGERVDAAAGTPAIERDGSVWTPRGAILEHLQNGPDGVEQSWLFPWQPGGSGDLDVRIRATGLDPAGETASGLHFVDAGSGLGVRYGKATWIDRLGVATEVAARLEGSDLVLTVPAAVVDGSVFPAVLDPLIEAELEIDRPVAGGSTWAPAGTAAASTGTMNVVVWADPQRGGVFGARVDLATGNVLDPDAFLVWADPSAATPTIACGPSQCLVAWASAGIALRRFQPASMSWTDATPVPASSTAGDASPSAGVDPVNGNFVVFWQRGTTVPGYHVGASGTGTALVNIATGTASYPRVADAIGGRYLVVWAAANGVQGYRINSSTGSKQNGQLTITNSGAVSRVGVASDGSSEWVVVALNGSGDVVGRRVSSGGSVSGTNPVTLTSAGSLAQPTVAYQRTTGGVGYWILGWMSTGAAPQVYWEQIRTSGTGNSRSVAAVTSGTSAGPASAGAPPFGMATAASGAVRIAWPSGAEIRSVLVSPAPAAGASTALSTPPSRAQAVPAVAASASGYLAVWQDARSAATDIYAARLDRGGALVGSPFAVASTSATEAAPAVASDGTSWLVVWSDGAVKGSIVSAAGAVATSPVTLSGAAAQGAPRVAFANGRYLVVWTDGAGVGAPNVAAAQVTAAGAAQGPIIAIANGSGAEQAPDVAPSPSGDGYQVVWQDARTGTDDIYGRHVTSLGAADVQLPISTATGVQSAPAIACGGGGCLVAWADARGATTDVYAARLSGTGAVLDAAGLEVGAGPGSQLRPSVAWDGRDFLLAYEDRSTGAAQPWGNRVSTSGAVLDGAGLSLGAAGALAGAAPRLASADAGRALLVYTAESTSIPGVSSVWARLLAYRNGLALAKAGTGTGRVVSTPAGIDCGTGCASATGSFDAGPAVVLTATPDANMRFAGWSGDCSGTGTCSVATDVARTVTATFDRIEWALTVTRSGGGTGTVNADAGGITCGSTCSASYLQGTLVTLTASPAQGSAFTGWSGAGCSGTGPCAVTMDAAKAVTAQFQVAAHDVTATVPGGNGSVSFSTDGATGSCGASCTTYVDGTIATLTAVPAAGYRLASWGGDCTGAGACSLLVNAARSVTATFEIIPPVLHTLAVTKTGSGTVASTDARITCGLLCSAQSATYVEGTSVTLTAVPEPGWSFGGWGGACSGTGDCTVTVSADVGVSATFAPLPPPPRQLDVALAGAGAGSVASSPAGIACQPTCTASFASGTPVTLTATPAPPPPGGGTYVFSGWGGACTGTGTCQVTLDAARSVTATFDFVPPTYRALTVSNGGGGTVTDDAGRISCGAACVGSYVDGTVVTLSATPAPGGTFAGWGGAYCGGTGPCVVTMDAARAVTATFAFPVAVVRAGSGSGSVSSTPAAISCGNVCLGSFVYGTTVSLSASPTLPAAFTGWAGAGCSGSGACAFQVTGPTTVTATFDIPPPQRWDLTVVKQGAGTGTVTSDLGGIACGATCGATYDAGTVVNLTAGASAGSTFGGWSGGGCSGAAPTCRVTMDAAKAVTARFDVAPPSTYLLGVARTGSGTGTVTSSPAGISCGAACSASFSSGATVTLTAAPSTGSAFAGWSGGGCSGLGTCTVSMTAAASVSAAFAASSGGGTGSFPLATAVGGPGAGTVTADADLGLTCDRGTLCVVDVATASPPRVVTLHATAASGSRFAGWIDACSGTDDCVLAMDRSQLARAVFVPRLAELRVALTGRGSIAATPAGAVACDGSACVGHVETAGAPVTLTAVPAAGWHFVRWIANECTGSAPCTVATDRDRSLAALFAPDSFALTVRVLGGRGAAHVVGEGIDCADGGGACTVAVPNAASPQQVTLTAQPDADSVFSGWIGGCGSDPSCTLTVAGASYVIATFAPRSYDVTIQLLGLGAGSVSGGGLSCTTGSVAGCGGGVPRGLATFEATPEPGSFFAGWGGVCPRTTDPTCTVDFLGSGYVQAMFEPFTLPLQVGIQGPGSVAGPAGFSCSGDGATCTLDVDNTVTPERAQVTLTATPAPGATLWGWSGPCAGSGDTCTVTMSVAQLVVAHFRP